MLTFFLNPDNKKGKDASKKGNGESSKIGKDERLLIASKGGKMEEIEALILQGANINYQDVRAGVSPLL
jgi:hypothetical protein